MMIRFRRSFIFRRRSGRLGAWWPILLLVGCVCLGAASVLGFMGAAITNERAAMRQHLLESYQSHFASVQEQIAACLDRTLNEVQNIVTSNAPAAAFATLVKAKKVECVVVYDSSGIVAYPNRSLATKSQGHEAAWSKARALERERNFHAAASNYAAVAHAATNRNLAAQSLQAQVRCLYQAGERSGALRVLTNTLLQAEYLETRDHAGRLLSADAHLLALEILAQTHLPEFKKLASALHRILDNYGNSPLASAQRRFLMKALQGLAPGEYAFGTLEAEELAAQFVEHQTGLLDPKAVHPGRLPGIWQLVSSNKNAVVLFNTDGLASMLHSNLALPANIRLGISPLMQSATNALTVTATFPSLPGWIITIQPRDEQELSNLTSKKISGYIWAGVFLIGGMFALSLLAAHFIQRRLALARMKNDLAATVSHELKTPLAAIRVLTDTLLEGGVTDRAQTREYLQLISGENVRLQNLIEKFLTFSRLEQQKYSFDFQETHPREMLGSLLGRIWSPELQTDIADDLPHVRIDRDAFSSALGNLIENAYKYSGEPKQVLLRVGRAAESVLFQVQDNGIGLSSGEARNIFKPFYQVDQRLSRNGSGCGLGLSIVEMIVHAHGGKVRVDSAPGSGSTFTIELPALPPQLQRRAA